MRSGLFSLEKILGVCEKICYFFVINLLFVICNLPVLLFFVFIGISQVRTYLPLFLCTMLLMPPAFCAVLYAMNRLLEGRERGAVRDYLQGYRADFFKKLRLGFAQLLVILILWTNIEFFTKQIFIAPLAVLFGLLFAYVILMTPNLYLLSSRYEMSNKEIVKSACIMTITQPVCTLGFIAAMGVVLMAFELFAGTTVLFMASIYAFLVVFISKGKLRALEESQ